MLVQVEPQSLLGAGQVLEQAPATQASPVLQAVVQSPQCAGSFFVSKHDLSHLVRVPGQVVPQPDVEQLSPSAHLVPQVPQLFGSVFGLVQASPHLMRGAVHEELQAPLLQTSPDLQAFPQVPQLLLSVLMLVQVLPHRTWSPVQPVSLVSDPVSVGFSVMVLLEEQPMPRTKRDANDKSDARLSMGTPFAGECTGSAQGVIDEVWVKT